jgi:hypothetical protein
MELDGTRACDMLGLTTKLNLFSRSLFALSKYFPFHIGSLSETRSVRGWTSFFQVPDAQ